MKLRPSALFLALAALPSSHAADLTIEGGTNVTVPGDYTSPLAVDLLEIGKNGTGSLTVSGAGSSVTATGLLMGRAAGGAGNLTISSGGNFSILGTASANIGDVDKGTVLVTGAGSTFSANNIALANLTGSSLTVESGGGVSSTYFGTNGGNSVRVTGADATLNVTQTLYAHALSTFTVENGGSVTAGSFNVHTTDIVVSGNGSKVTAANLDVGSIANNGDLKIQSGGNVTSTGTMALGYGSGNSHVLVTGAGSTLKQDANGQNLFIGQGRFDAGLSGLTVADGGSVVAGSTGTGTISFRANNSSLNIGNGGAAGTVQATEVKGNSNTVAAKVNFNHTGSTTFSANVTGNAVSVTKSGSGTTTLTGASTYRGATTVSAGTLLNNGSLGVTAVTVGNGATFGGTGTHGGTTILLAGATISPGASTGTFTTGATTFNADAGYLWELGDASGTAGSGWDTLNITGALFILATEADPFQIVLEKAGSLFNFNPLQDYDFVVATATGGITGFSEEAFEINAAGIPESGSGAWSFGRTGNSLVLSYSAVPEPSAAVLGALGLLAVLRRRR